MAKADETRFRAFAESNGDAFLHLTRCSLRTFSPAPQNALINIHQIHFAVHCGGLGETVPPSSGVMGDWSALLTLKNLRFFCPMWRMHCILPSKPKACTPTDIESIMKSYKPFPHPTFYLSLNTPRINNYCLTSHVVGKISA